MKTALVILATGFEEVEALTPIDYLRRAGVEVTGLGLGGRTVAGSHGIKVEAEKVLEDLAPDALYDVIVVPGGAGAGRIAASPLAVGLIQAHHRAGRLVAAICAAPALVLGEACGILGGRRFTCFPGYEDRVPGGRFSAERVVEDGTVITSRSPGTAGEFSVALVARLVGKEAADALAAKVLLLPD